MENTDTLKMVTDLYGLRNDAINVVLFKLEAVQGAMAAEAATTAHARVIERLSVKEIVLKEVIAEIWNLHFGEDKDGCG